ncbi:MAG: glycosyl hydrolase [Ignavibacteriaceae bacterium]|nr:glycosyl hydrolase [Ignavibacteriaceae bacterium]
MKKVLSYYLILSVCLIAAGCGSMQENIALRNLKKNFISPPDSVKPGVYWYFMDGNLSKEEITGDLESMKEAGIGSVLFLEVNVGVPRGQVDFLSDKWQDIFAHAVRECERLGITFTLGIGPGWTGSGGPWVKPEQSMQHLVYSATEVSGHSVQKITLKKPEPRKPFFGEDVLTDKMKLQRDEFYEDVALLAFPTPKSGNKIEDIDEKALYYRAPYSSQAGVKPYLPEPVFNSVLPVVQNVKKEQIIDLTNLLQKDGTLNWEVPDGNWTIMRFGRRNNGAVTRPAPVPGLGFECDKFDTLALDSHFNEYVGKLIQKVNPVIGGAGGWKMLHMDSWEMGSQNWTKNFREEFKHRRGYDPLPFYPVYSGTIVGSKEISERFLWDLRITAQELVFDNHVRHLKELGRKYGLGLSIEPYDMNPCADLELGSLADVPMCEFWSKGFGFNTQFSCFEASSIANVLGINVVQSESFTSFPTEAWKLYPGAIKNQGDWAFCTGINKFFYHTFAHKSIGNQYRPGMTMGPYGIHWDRGQTWWPMVSDYHKYISRCSYMLQQGRKTADILYLTPEGAPQVFRPPTSALAGNDTIPDHKAYNFDGCSPNVLISKAGVKDNKIVFPGGASYSVLVLPFRKSMTPELLDKIESLVKAGAIIIGAPPVQSPSLVNYPECDKLIKQESEKIWGQTEVPLKLTERNYGEGKIYWGGEIIPKDSTELYPGYDAIVSILNQLGVQEDFVSSGPVRYVHHITGDLDIYFISNSSDKTVNADCLFRVNKKIPQLWDPLTGKVQNLSGYSFQENRTSIPICFEPNQSFFIVFDKEENSSADGTVNEKNINKNVIVKNITGDWNVSFDSKWGGPDSVVFNKLEDWSKRPEEGMKYYSGIAAYKKNIELKSDDLKQGNSKFFLELGEVNNLARVRLNGKDLGAVWAAPWHVDITDVLKEGNNELEIDVANLWVNRLIGDEQFPYDGVKDGRWPDWLTEGKPRTSGRYTFTTHNYYKKDSPLLKSGLIGPVKIVSVINE